MSLRKLTTAFPVLTLHLAMGLAFCGIALALAVVPSLFGGRTWLLAWPALSLLWVGVGYVWLGPVVVGKKADGTFRWPAALVLMPYLAAVELAWYAVRVLGQEPPWQEVAHGLYLGRRVEHWELPSRVSFVLDMTAEFVEPEEVREGRRYVCVPTLDGAAPNIDQLARVVLELLSFQGNVYVHCAAGYGRSATAMAVLLVAREAARDVEHAIAVMRAARPRVRLRTSQRRSVERVLARLSELRVAKASAPRASLAQST